MPEIDPVRVKILMLKKGIKPKKLGRRFGVTRAAISMALSGQRKELLGRIFEYVKKHPERKRKAA